MKSDLTREERLALGIADDDSYDIVLSVDTPRRDDIVGEGRGAESIAETVAKVRALPVFTPVGEIPLRTGQSLYLSSWDKDPLVKLLEAPELAALRWEGTAAILEESRSRGPGILVVRAISVPVVVRYPDEDRELGILVNAERTTVVRAPARYEEAIPVAFPETGDLLARLDTEPWLERAAAELAGSPSILDRVAAIGLIARLWEPPNPAVVRSLDYLMAGHESPADRALAWAKTLDGNQLSLLERLALDAIDVWCEDLESFGVALSERPEDAQLLGEDLLFRRDDLESIRIVLQFARNDELVSTALAGLDRRAASQLSAVSTIVAVEDPRLEAVFRTQPWAWWSIASDAHG